MSNVARIYLSVIITATVIACSCTPEMVPIKGKYVDSAVVIRSTKSVDATWLNVVGLFNTNGLQIKNLDKNKGKIVTTKIPINAVYTSEDKDGQLVQPKAWVVLAKAVYKKKEWKPKEIYGEWNIQVSQLEKGTTIIKVDPIVLCTYFPNAFTKMETQGRSTGKLEELLKQF